MRFLQWNIIQSTEKNLIIRNNSVVSVGMFNKSNISYKIVLDFSQSKNLLFSSKVSKIEKV